MVTSIDRLLGYVIQARRQKADRTKDIGELIAVGSKVIKAIVRGNEVWTAESAHVARRVDLKVRASR